MSCSSRSVARVGARPTPSSRREVLVKLPAGDLGAALLGHPSIVRVFDQGEDNGAPYAVLEYLPGGSLEQRLAAGSTVRVGGARGRDGISRPR